MSLSALIDRVPAMIWRTDVDGKCTYVNATWLAFTGRLLAQERGDGWMDSVHPADIGRCREILSSHAQQRQPFEREYRLRRHDGVYRRVLDRGEPFIDEVGNFDGFVGSCVDVESLVAAEAGNGGLDDFFEMSLDNVCVAGLDGYFKRVNPSWTRTLGWTAEELLSRPSIEFVHPEDREQTLGGRERLRSGLPMGPLVNRYVCKDGSHRWFEWRSVAHADRALVYAVARDVTEQKQAEQCLHKARDLEKTLRRQLIFSDRMASVGTLAAGVAHEINNPLAYVTANVGLILEELDMLSGKDLMSHAAELKAMALEVQTGAERIRKITRGLKTFSRAEEERRSTIDIVPLLELSVDMTFNEIRHRARLVKDFGKIPLVVADDARLGQVFINLIVNAAQAIPEGNCSGNEIRIRTSTDDEGCAVVEVSDTGSGIPTHAFDRIFEPFFTTKAVGVGTGLGLSICHNIVTGLGGQISVKSQEGRGTTFRVVLRPAETTNAAVVAAPTAAHEPLVCAAVLVVDDEPAIGLVLRRLLRNHEVACLTNARDALDLLNTGKRFDVIFCDIMMPEMSGMEFFDEITRHFPDVAPRVVFLSGGAFTPNAHAFLDKVPNHRINKPFDPKGVRELVQSYLGDRQNPM